MARHGFVKLPVETNCIDNAKIDLVGHRPHPSFGTLEFRAGDMPMRASETTVSRIMESEWRALRYGLGCRGPGFDIWANDRQLMREGRFLV